MPVSARVLLPVLLTVPLVTSGCKSDRSETSPAASVAASPASQSPAGDAAGGKPAADETASAEGVSGHHRQREGSDWVPAEYKKGRGKWKETGVYVDGVPVGILRHGELPPELEAVWIGDDEPGDEQTQRFRLMDYLADVGVALGKIKEVHLYGGGLHTVVISGRDARKYAKEILFRFGHGTAGKVLFSMPSAMKVNTSFDKLSAVAVYVHKKPPKLDPDSEHVLLDGKVVWKIPYFGDPIRGGVRIYKNDRLALHLKRNQLEESKEIAEWTADKKELHWKLGPFLEKYGVDLADVDHAVVIRDEARFETLGQGDLIAAYFTALPQASGQILVNGSIRVQGLALYTTPGHDHLAHK